MEQYYEGFGAITVLNYGKTTKKDLQSAANFITRSGKKKHNCDSGMPFYKDGYTYVTDCYQALRTVREDVIEWDKAPKVDALYSVRDGVIERTEAPHIVDVVVKMFSDEYTDNLDLVPYYLPRIEQLKSEIENQKQFQKEHPTVAKKDCPIVYEFCDGFAVNAVYLLNALKATRATICFAPKVKGTGDEAYQRGAVYFYGEDTEYMLLPLFGKGWLGPFRINGEKLV